jgi:2-oxoglutarate ferredoxin oxidoreductase subunit gamma
VSCLNLLFAGFGGQGILFAGKLTAYAGLIEGRELSWLPSYGPEMRGGTANCSVCLADEPIGSPLVLEPDVLIAMNQPSLDKFIGDVVPGGIVIVDSSVVPNVPEREDVRIFKVPATQLAEEAGLKGLGNVILVGKLWEETRFCDRETLDAAIRKSVSAKRQNLVDANLKAIGIGMES